MATEERHEEVRQSNIEACPAVESLEIIGEKWRLNVLHALQDAEELRFNELKRATNARSRTLSQTLETLMDHGLVDRRAEEADPIAVYYSLTEKGEALEPVFEDLEAWAEEWHESPWA